jgi:hypothetical protein
MRSIACIAFCVSALLAACGDEESFDNLPDCVVDHASLGEAEAIAHCLIDFPDLHPEFEDQAACVDWVADNGGYADSRDDACTDYFEETGQ